MATLIAKLVSGLPDNADRALLILRDRVKEIVNVNGLSDRNSRQILGAISAWIKKYGEEVEWKIPLFAGGTSDKDKVTQILRTLDAYELTIESAFSEAEASAIFESEDDIRKKETFGIAILSDLDKEKIREHISNIRRLIQENNLLERKKIALLSRLSLLESELETLGTKTDRFFAFMGDAAFAMGEFATKAKPFTTEVKEMLKIILKGREDTEGVRLPRRQDDFLLPMPDET